MNKKGLAVLLSKLATFESPDAKLEQYQTPSEIAAEALWAAYMNNDIEGKVIFDLGCGAGIFGIGALILGAKKVTFVDIDKNAITLAKKNKEFIEKALGNKVNARFVNKNISSFRGRADGVIQNPPFGVQTTHTDKLFLLKAMECADVVYSFHKIVTKEFVERLANDNGFSVLAVMPFKFPLQRTFWFHTKRTYNVDVGLFVLKRQKQKSLKKATES